MTDTRNTGARRSRLTRRVAALILAGVGTAAAVLIGAAPASADPPYAKPDLDVNQCWVFDDPVNYGDGIDWWKVSFTYSNEGYTSTVKSFTVSAFPAWQPGVGNEVEATAVVPALARNAWATQTFWVTANVVATGTWYVYADTKHEITENDETDNLCSTWANPT